VAAHGRTWASPHTDGVYPLDWDISIPRVGLTVRATTAVDDQEMWNPAQNYWEGPIVITGTRDGVPVTGQGYAELTGYASDPMDP
jgi:predicted secreted hydrolase